MCNFSMLRVCIKQYSYTICSPIKLFSLRYRERIFKMFMFITMTSSSPPDVFLGNGVLKICSKFTGERPCQGAIYWNLSLVWVSPVNLLHIFRALLNVWKRWYMFNFIRQACRNRKNSGRGKGLEVFQKMSDKLVSWLKISFNWNRLKCLEIL